MKARKVNGKTDRKGHWLERKKADNHGHINSVEQHLAHKGFCQQRSESPGVPLIGSFHQHDLYQGIGFIESS